MNGDQSSGSPPSRSDPSRPRVVVAEDDERMRQLVADVVRREGCEVEELADGEQLLVRVVTALLPRHQASRIDLVISDVRMPFCSGLDVLKKLRVANNTTPVILMTAFGDRWLRDRVQALDGRLLDKPFTLLALREAVREVLPRAPHD